MAISASQIVQVLPRILTGTGSDLVFNGLVLTSNATLRANTPTSFSSADSVGEYFGTNSNEYTFASIYFGGYNNSQKKPSLLYFYRLTPEAAAPWVRGAELTAATALTAIKAITAGDFSMTFSGTEVALTGLDFSSVTSLSAAAETLQTAIQAASEATAVAGATVSYNSTLNAFTVTSGDTGEEASVTCPTGNLAAAMGFDLDAGTAVISAGAEAATVTDSMTALTRQFQNFVTFTTIDEPSDDDALALAQWATTQANAGTMYLYVCWDSSAANLDESSTACVAEILKANNVGATTVCYPSYKQAALIQGIAASIDWDQLNGTLTFAFKNQSGLGADVADTDDAVALEAHSVNYIGNFATRNDEFVFLYNGCMLGDWAWIDTYLNAVWLCNALQVQLMAMFTANRRIPYTEAGYSIVRANARDVINRGINNGVINAGVLLSDAQKATLTQELGADYSDEIYTNGYYLQVVDATATTRQERESPACNLVYTYGGAIHRLTVPAIAVV